MAEGKISKKSQCKSISTMESYIKMPLDKETLKELVEKAKDWGLMHGIAMRLKSNFDPDALCSIPFILFPSPFPRSEFEKVVTIQPVLNELMHKVASDSEFLRRTLKETVNVDGFTKKLFDIFEIVQKEGRAQPLSLGIVRSDYMLHKDCGRLKQVEINTMACSSGGVGSKIVDLHRYILEELGQYDQLKNLPENNALAGLCNGMIKAWELYNKESAVILFIVEDITYNICDQRFHEFEIKKLRPSIKVIRRTLTQLANYAKLGSNKELLIEDKFEVAFIYFRAGYEPQHYPTEKEWNVRLLMERSLAIKSPTIGHQLAGSKKVQEVLARPNVLEKFIKNKESERMVLDTFTGLYSLDFDDSGEKVVQMALEAPEKFVLKPQRDGGGYNVYGAEVRTALMAMKDNDKRLAWILMDKIVPPSIQGYMIRLGSRNKLPDIVDLVSELGIFGIFIGNDKEIFVNEQVGHMLRTKLATANEGGITTGVEAFDSPYLVD